MIAIPLTRVAGHHPMGLSTGVAGRGDDWPALVRAACAVSTHAVELAAHDADELDGLVAYLAGRPRLPFRHVSVHTPIKGALGTDAERVAALKALPAGVRALIAHPDTVADPAPWRALGRRVVFENMDDRKAGGRTADELEALFAALPEAGFCLDIAHAHTLDPTMNVATELLDRFRGRLREVHLSSIRAGAHTTLLEADEALFGPVLSRCRDVPWILEAAPPARWSVGRARLPMRSVGEQLAA
jgi:sugar phosphate isomerase/epimerase